VFFRERGPVSALLIRGGTVADGTGHPSYRADIRVRNGMIAEIGPDLEGDGEPWCDAGGAVVAPGFIDSHTHLDPVLFWDPACDPLPQHGVTTVVTGNCSLSLAPLLPEHRAELVSVFSYIEDVPRAVLAQSIPWGWSGWSGYQRVLAERAFGVNVAGLVGHTPLRMSAMGGAAWERPAVASERERMAGLLRECLAAGAFGLSTSLFDADASGRPVPSRLADDAELAALLDTLAGKRAVLSFIPDVASHAATLAGVERMAALCAPRGVTATWNGLFHDERKPARARELLDQASRLQDTGARMFPQVSPRRQDVRVNWDGGMAFYSLPPWHQFLQASAAGKVTLAGDPSWRAAARAGWDAAPRTLIRHKELDRVVFTAVARPELARWVGSSLADRVAFTGAHPSDALADWVLANDGHPGVTGTGIANADPDGVAQLLRHPATLVSNSDAGAHVQMMCTAGDTTLLLARYVRDRADLGVEHAVRELTGRQAEVFGLRGRGVIATGYAADLTVFDPAALRWREEVLTADLPGGGLRLRRPPGGFRFTVVAGTVVQHDGTLTGALPGVVLHPAARDAAAGGARYPRQPGGRRAARRCAPGRT
jgi:N-acyl-D-amino-acid deacylase